jgi:hypothetical protein
VAQSPSHRVGQIIGDALEKSVAPLLQGVADEYGLYLDVKGDRPARGKKRLMTWVDGAGNKHNLDFVLEEDGTTHQVGAPVAFIEVAWRRYTKHSVNKAGEIANALLPLRQTFAHTRPFTGAVVAGEWTEGGLTHMRSQGIQVLFVPRETVVDAFARFGIDLSFDESTREAHLAAQVDAWDALDRRQRDALIRKLANMAPESYAKFRERIVKHLTRRVTRVLVLPLFGSSLTFGTTEEAADALRRIDDVVPDPDLHRVEIQIRYSNDDRIEANFGSAADAIDFLGSHPSRDARGRVPTLA